MRSWPTPPVCMCVCVSQAMLAEYAANPREAWKAKDCAIYLVLALTVRGKTGETMRKETVGAGRQSEE